MRKNILLFVITLLIFLVTLSCSIYKASNPSNNKKMGTVTDIDGNVYKTIKIGKQLWMAENLRVTHYQNGDPIPNVSDKWDWQELITGAYCDYRGKLFEVSTYGRLYNWYALKDNRNIAPKGWHIPTDEEWKQLEIYLGMSRAEANSTDWRGVNTGSKLAGNANLWIHGDLETNAAFGESGFSAVPGGFRFIEGVDLNRGGNTGFWSSTEVDNRSAWARFLNCSYSSISRGDYSKRYGFAVRCVKD